MNHASDYGYSIAGQLPAPTRHETAAQKTRAILADPGASYWLQNALRTTANRDAIDALYDAEALVEILRHRVEEILGAGRRR